MEDSELFSPIATGDAFVWLWICVVGALASLGQTLSNGRWKSWGQTLGMMFCGANFSAGVVALVLMFWSGGYKYPLIMIILAGCAGQLSKDAQERIINNAVESWSRRKGLNDDKLSP